MGESSTVKAQRLANDTNIQIAQETNQANKDIAEAANELEYKMFQEQNDWNLARRDEEWEYNSPSAQMERYIEAGINPLWAMSSGNLDAGKAQQLTSAEYGGAHTAEMQAAHVEPEYDPYTAQKAQAIVGAANSVINGALGWTELGLKSEELQAKKPLYGSQSVSNLADASYKKSLTQGQEVANAFNTETYTTRIQTQVAQYSKLQQDVENARKEGRNSDAIFDNLTATKDLIAAETANYQSQIEQRMKQMELLARQVSVQERNATVNENQYSLNKEQFEFTKSFETTKYDNEVAKLTNDELYRWASKFGSSFRALGKIDGKFDMGFGVGMSAGAEMEGKDFKPNFAAYKAAQVESYKRMCDNPTKENTDNYIRISELLPDLPQMPENPDTTMQQPIRSNAAGFSVLNPSDY